MLKKSLITLLIAAVIGVIAKASLNHKNNS